MPSGLKRYHNFGHDHFVTFSCYRRLPYLDNDHARTGFLDVLVDLDSDWTWNARINPSK